MFIPIYYYLYRPKDILSLKFPLKKLFSRFLVNACWNKNYGVIIFIYGDEEYLDNISMPSLPTVSYYL